MELTTQWELINKLSTLDVDDERLSLEHRVWLHNLRFHEKLNESEEKRLIELYEKIFRYGVES